MLHPVLSYFRFLWYSKNEHAVHSPFVFKLLTKCFYQKNEASELKQLAAYRKKQFSNTNVIEITDLGAGSKVFASNKRIIAEIAKKAGINKKRAQLLTRVIGYFAPKAILELGTSVGLATSAISIGAQQYKSNATIISVEGCPTIADYARIQLQNFGFENIQVINSEFSLYLKEVAQPTFDLVYFDGNHSKDATVAYFTSLLPNSHNDSVWIFDDIHWSKEMEEAWNYIKKHPKVTVTIDTYKWGFVFFRKEQPKEHFIIRV